MSLRRFEGWMPSYPGESEWNEQERAWILALLECRRLTCSGCGGWLPETANIDADEFRAPPPLRCGPCTAIGRGQEAYAEGYRHTGAHMGATHWYAERR